MLTTTSGSPVIQTQDLRKIYSAGHASREVMAIRALNLRVPRHTIFGFIGPNGAGKTTAIKLLLGLARPTGGSAAILGHDVIRDSLEIRKRVGYLPQEPRFFEHMTARETLRFKARFFFAGPAPEIEERVSEMLDLVGLSDKADRPIQGFSGGERQRLGIAQAQVNRPDLLILDEPAASLDPLGRRDVLEVMKRLRQHTTIFYSTHILDDVQQVSDVVAIMNRGELIAQAPLHELLAGGIHQTYAVTLEGDARAAQARVERQAWVAGLHATRQAGRIRWEVRVTDDAAAKSHLLRLVLEDPGVQVIEFSPKSQALEEVFFDMVGKGRHA